MRKLFITLLILFATRLAFADSVLIEGFEYANHDGEIPVGWVCDDDSWLAGYLEKDHNRVAHSGNWYAYTNSSESWMFMPMFMSEALKYRFSLWAISDGGFQLEIWAGNAANSSSMTQLLVNETISNGYYEKFSTYIEEMTSNFDYFGIHAVSTSSNCILTIDDIQIDMVDKYDITVNPTRLYIDAAPGAQVSFHCEFKNLGYMPANVIITCISDYFPDVHLYKNGVVCSTFHAEPDESVELTGVATFTQNINIGDMGWADIIFTLDCDCATTMFSLWATAVNESMDEYGHSSTSIYPNPSSGIVTVEGTGIITITNALGQEVLKKEIFEKEIITLDKGVYFIRKDDDPAQKIIIGQ